MRCSCGACGFRSGRFARCAGEGRREGRDDHLVAGPVPESGAQSAKSYLDQIDALIAAHPQDLATFLAEPANAAAKGRMQSLQGALYDYAVNFATPGQKDLIAKGLVELIRKYPQYFSLQPFDAKRQPGLASLAVQTWLTLLVADYYDPAARKALAVAMSSQVCPTHPARLVAVREAPLNHLTAFPHQPPPAHASNPPPVCEPVRLWGLRALESYVSKSFKTGNWQSEATNRIRSRHPGPGRAGLAACSCAR